MTDKQLSVALVLNNSETMANIGPKLAGLPGLRVEERQATMAELNGAAAKLSGEMDIIIFRTDTANEEDIAAIKELTSAGESAAKIVAVGSDTMTLADTRRLISAGVADVLPDSASPDEMREAVMACLSPKPEVVATVTPIREPGKVITVTPVRGGAGSTTIAVNLADRLQMGNQRRRKENPTRVVLVDFDIQFGTVAAFLDVDPCECLFQLAMDGNEPDGLFVEQSIATLPSGLSVITAPEGLAPLDSLKPLQIEKLIDILRDRFDYVVVDAPRALVGWLSPLFKATDQMLMVTDSSVPSIRQARRLIDFYTEDNLNLNIEIVINHEAEPTFRRRHHFEASKVLERPFRHWIPEDPVAAREALDRGVPLSAAAKRSKLSKSLGRLERAIVASLREGAPHENKSKS